MYFFCKTFLPPASSCLHNVLLPPDSACPPTSAKSSFLLRPHNILQLLLVFVINVLLLLLLLCVLLHRCLLILVKMRSSRRFLHLPRQNLPASVWLNWLFPLAAVLAAGKSLQGVPSVRICCTSGLEPDILRPWHSVPPLRSWNTLPPVLSALALPCVPAPHSHLSSSSLSYLPASQWHGL